MFIVQILGIPFAKVTEEEAAQILAKEALGEKNTFTVFTPNPRMAMLAQRDDAFLATLRSADLCLADGTGIVGAAKRRGTPLPGRTTGIGTAEKALQILGEKQGSVYLLGGKAGVAAEAAAQLVRTCPGLRIAGTRDGYFPEEEAAAVAREIAAAEPDLLCVCLGSPGQERFLSTYGQALRAGAAIGLGGALDVWAGRVTRAPALWQRLGLEWLWRMLREPKRFRILPDLVRFRLLTRH